MKLFPEEKAAIVDALNDTSHGVFLDPAAAWLWKGHYLAALRLDPDKMNLPGLRAARQHWRDQALADPSALLVRLGPELPCELHPAKVRIVILDEENPVRFDLNTVQPGILRLIPGVSETEIAALLAARGRRPFTGRDDFQARAGLLPATLAALKF